LLLTKDHVGDWLEDGAILV